MIRHLSMLQVIHLEMVKLLLRKGAKVDVLWYVCELRNVEFFCSTSLKQTPLMQAVQNNLVEFVKELLLWNADPTVKSNNDKSALELASQALPEIQKLIEESIQSKDK